MDDLVRFIEQRLTEDELWAKAASAPPSYYVDERPVPSTGVHWTWAVGENWTPYRVDPLEEFVGESANDYGPSLVTVEEWPRRYGPAGRMSANKVLSGEEVATGVGGHIVRHDPNRVLRDVAALRRVLELYRTVSAVPADSQDAGFVLALEEVLLAFAAVHREHPDFLPHWAEGDPTDG